MKNVKDTHIQHPQRHVSFNCPFAVNNPTSNDGRNSTQLIRSNRGRGNYNSSSRGRGNTSNQLSNRVNSLLATDPFESDEEDW